MTSADSTTSHAHVVTRGAFVNLIGNLGKFSFLGFDLVATRMLGADIFGYYSTTWLILNLCFIICYFGAHRVVIDFVARSKNRGNDNFYKGVVGCITLSFLLSVLLVVAVFAFSREIATFFNKPPIAEYLRIMVLSAPLYCLTTILLSATRGLKIMRVWVIVRQALEPLLDLVLILLLIFVFSMSDAPFWARAGGFFCGSVASLWFFSSYFDLSALWKARPGLKDWRHIIIFGFPVMLADFLFNLMLRLDIIPLSILVPAGQVAVFQIVLNIGNVMRNIPMAIDPIMMPVVVEMRHRNDLDALNEIYRTLIRISLYLCLGFVAVVVMSGDLLLGLYGPGFDLGARALVVVVIALAINTIFSTIEPVLVMSGYPYINLFNSVFFVTSNLIVDFLLIPQHGLMGAAWGCFMASVLTAIIQILEFYLVLRLKPLSTVLLKPVAIVTVLMIIAYFFQIALPDSILYRSISTFLLAFLYFWTGWRFFFGRQEREWLRGIIHVRPGTPSVSP